MAWDIRCAVYVRDAQGLRPASAGEVQVRVIRGGTGGISSIAKDTDSNGEAYFERCPGTLGTTECGMGVWGIKYIHKLSGKWIAGNLTIYDGTSSFEWTEGS